MSANVKRWMSLAAVATVVAVVLMTLLAWAAVAQGPYPWMHQGGWGPGGMMGGWGTSGTQGPGMMGGWGSSRPFGPAQGVTSTLPSGWGPGGRGPGGMMGGWGSPGTGTPISMDRAVEAARQYVASYGNPDLTLTEVMEFTNNFYAEVEEESTGVHAFELLVDRYTGAVYPEPGPNMMWNTKYGHMGGMMGGWWQQTGDPPAATADQVRVKAQQWLDANLPGTTVAPEADAFYGYYTIHTLKDGEVSGMLSVNSATGRVWYHAWHGDFVGMRELED
jgi:hypothetical protein